MVSFSLYFSTSVHHHLSLPDNRKRFEILFWSQNCVLFRICCAHKSKKCRKKCYTSFSTVPPSENGKLIFMIDQIETKAQAPLRWALEFFPKLDQKDFLENHLSASSERNLTTHLFFFSRAIRLKSEQKLKRCPPNSGWIIAVT